MTENEAWELYCERGVTPPGFAPEIAKRRQLLRQWENTGRSLR